MLLGILASILLGVTFGTFTGLIPGIHINLIGVFVVSLSTTLFLKLNPLILVVFITSMAITHTFIDFIPSIFLGCPDTDTELSVLPGHELLKKGQGYQAIALANYGSLAAIIILVLIVFPSTLFFSNFYELIKNSIPFILIATSIFLIFLEKNKISAIIVFVITGILGLCVLNLESAKEPLLPLLTGLFGSSMLVKSIKSKTKIPEQIIEKPKIKSIKPFLGSLVAPICSFLPGLGSGQAAILGHTITRSKKQEDFLILLGTTNTLVMGFSFLSLYLISKTRTGAAVAIQELVGSLNPPTTILIVLTIIFAGVISFFLTNILAKKFSTKINKINYRNLSILTLIILAIVTILVSGILGFLILVISTATGLYCISTGTRRTQMMGCLLLPTILFYL